MKTPLLRFAALSLLALSCPVAQGVTFTVDITVEADDTTYDGQPVVVDGCTLTLNGSHAFTRLLILHAGRVTHSPAPAGQADHRLQLTIAQDLTIDSSSRLDVSGQGYGPASGPGAGGLGSGSGGGGGGFGGTGGRGDQGSGGSAYGSLTTPADLGSGGGNGYNCTGGTGGGSIQLTVGGTLLVDGSIRAHGTGGGAFYSYGGGGGSGGSIFITAGTLAGSGLITAQGGPGGGSTAGGGAGGRTAIYYTERAFTGVLLAAPGTGWQRGAAGTIYLKAASEPLAQVILDAGGGAVGALTTVSNLTELPSLTVVGGANVRLADLTNLVGFLAVTNSAVNMARPLHVGGDTTLSNSTVVMADSTVFAAGLIAAGSGLLELNGTNTIGGDLRVLDGAILSHSAARITGLTVDVAGGVTIDGTSRLDVSGKGYGPASGPGAGSLGSGSGGGGGGFGGTGGRGDQGSGGLAYGALTAPVELGSGGGNGYNCTGGTGGGSIQLTVGGTLLVDGSIRAHGTGGGAFYSYGGGGGSGGSIFITAGTLAGSGLITAQGGPGGGSTAGGGAGGRTAIYCAERTFTGVLLAAPGTGWQRGAAGTIYLKGASEPLAQVILDAGGGTVGALTTLSNLTELPSLTVVGGANVRLVDLTNLVGFLAVTNSAVNVVRPLRVGGGANLSNSTVIMADSTVFAANLVLTGGGLLELNGTNTIGGDLRVLDGAVLSHSAAQSNGLRVDVAGGVTIDGTSRLDVSGKGYGPASGPGAGSLGAGSGGAGGGFGGVGGRGDQGSGGLAYGALTAPVELGSGGGDGYNCGGGTGGGSIQLTVGGTLLVDGSIRAHGTGGGAFYSYGGGGGSGGSILITVEILAGTGLISAQGGPGGGSTGGGGAGGRIAVYYAERTFSGSSLAAPGTGWQRGAAGTVYLKGASEPLAQIVLDAGGGAVGALTTLSNLPELPSLTVVGGANILLADLTNIVGGLAVTNSSVNLLLPLRVGGDATLSNSTVVLADSTLFTANLILAGDGLLELNGANTVGRDLRVMDGAVLSHSARQTNGLMISVLGGVTIGASGCVDVSGKGFGPGGGPGAGTNGPGSGGGGGGFGGTGGRGDQGAGGVAYGTLTAPVDLGSGGGNGYNCGGGTGGGSIQIAVAGTLRVDGSILSHGTGGAAFYSYGGGGGAGGSIFLRAGDLAGAGLIAANGGAGGGTTGGGGAGGRISVSSKKRSFTGGWCAYAGRGWQNGAAGTIYVQGGGTPLPQVVLDAGGLAVGALTTLSNLAELPALLVLGGANVRLVDLIRVAGHMAVTNSAVTVVSPLQVGGNVALSNSSVVFTVPSRISGSLTVAGGSRAELNGSNTVGADLWLLEGGVLSHTAGQSNGLSLSVAADVTVDASSRFDLSGQGYGPGGGLGAGTTGAGSGGGGAGHGGVGGRGDQGAGGIAYGLAEAPVELGSGGGNGYSCGGGTGAGALRLVLNGALRLDGSLCANGGAGGAFYSYGGGGGSGGSLYLTAGSLTGTGLITANGGAGGGATGGGGAGGRIALEIGDASGFSPTNVLARGGSGYVPGDAGTIYWSTGARTLSHARTPSGLVLTLPTRLGASYQLLLSTDLAEWSPVPPLRAGDGQPLTWLIPFTNPPAAFFRIEIR